MLTVSGTPLVYNTRAYSLYSRERKWLAMLSLLSFSLLWCFDRPLFVCHWQNQKPIGSQLLCGEFCCSLRSSKRDVTLSTAIYFHLFPVSFHLVRPMLFYDLIHCFAPFFSCVKCFFDNVYFSQCYYKRYLAYWNRYGPPVLLQNLKLINFSKY